MTLGDLIKILSTTSITTTYRAFEEGKSPGLPFICIVKNLKSQVEQKTTIDNQEDK